MILYRSGCALLVGSTAGLLAMSLATGGVGSGCCLPTPPLLTEDWSAEPLPDAPPIDRIRHVLLAPINTYLSFGWEARTYHTVRRATLVLPKENLLSAI
jgi:hypothetical protein